MEADWQEWQILDEIEKTYKKPVYDPYEVFKPTKAFLKEKIKELRQQCYEILHIINEAGTDSQHYEHNRLFVEMFWKPDLDKLNRRIRDYTYRLSPVYKRTAGEIGPSEIQRAKESPIQDYFAGGKLRRAGKDLVGLCPFQPNDKHPSFTIYDQGRRFKCFSCGVVGDTIDFIQKTHNLSFPLAVKYILKI